MMRLIQQGQITFKPPATGGPLHLVVSATKPGQATLFSDADPRFG
jgi:hypothetical protein